MPEWISEALANHEEWQLTRQSENISGQQFKVPPGCNLVDADLKEVNLNWAYLAGADLSRANLVGASLIQADLGGATLQYADLSWSDLNWARLSWANLNHTNLNGCNLLGANLTFANLSRADLRGANLSHADFSWACLFFADLRKASLDNANLTKTSLDGANLVGVKLSGVLGNSKEVISLQTTLHPVAYTQDRIQIGDKNYSLEECWDKDAEIYAYTDHSVQWWRIHKPLIKAWIEANPAVQQRIN